jgi:hypothetical protein
MKTLALIVTLSFSCLGVAAEKSFPEAAKEYFMACLRGNEDKDVKDFSWQVSKLYGFTLRQVKVAPCFYQEGKSFEQAMNEAIAFESKKGWFFRAILLIAIAGDLGIDPVVPENVRTYLNARQCSSCGNWWLAPRAYKCCRCTDKSTPRHCVLKQGHSGEHSYDLWTVLGPMPAIGEMQTRPYGP